MVCTDLSLRFNLERLLLKMRTTRRAETQTFSPQSSDHDSHVFLPVELGWQSPVYAVVLLSLGLYWKLKRETC